MISKFFIERPVLANVLAILMVVIGLVALYRLPVAQYPDVVPPTVQVTTRYPGASARTVVDTVALPIEQQVNGVEGMIYMQSYAAADGSYSLTVTFNIGVDLNFAQILVQNRVSSALASLPQAVQVQGVTVAKKSTAILQIVTLTSPDNSRDSLYLSNFATIRLKDEIARLPGVGSVSVFGAGQYSMRVWLDPSKMQTRGLTTQDVIQALQQQSAQVTAGQIGTPPSPDTQTFQYTLNVLGRLDDPEQFANVIVKAGKAGEIVRVRDIARVELGAQTYSQVFRQDSKPAAGMGLYLTPGANALTVAKEVQTRMKALAAEFPPGVTYEVPFDTTLFVTESINEVYKTLFEAAILVLIVILVFLQDWRAMLIPATTVPVTIIGAFAAMAAMGFTVNLSTLFAIVLSIGIVVDDAIIVVEGAAHNIEKGMSNHDAAVRAMDQLFGPIIGITLVLMSVFLPAAFLPGLTGRMYAQFALVIAATAILSAINAATLKPTQSAMWLRRPKPPEQRNFFYRGFNAVYARIENAYARLVGRMARLSAAMVVIALVIVSASFYGFSRIATGFLPVEDQGYLLASVQLPDGASLARTQKTLEKVTEIALKTPGVRHVISIAGLSALDNSAPLANAGVAYIILKEWSERGPSEGLLPLFTGLNKAMEEIEEARILVLPPPPIQGIGNAAGVTMQLELRDNSFDLNKLQTVISSVESNAETQSSIQRVMAPFRSKRPAVHGRSRSGEDRIVRNHGRPGLFCAQRLSRLGLCGPVHEIRPHLSDLYPGRFAIPAAAGGRPEPHRPQQERQHDPAWHPHRHQAGDRSVLDQPLQPLSVGNAGCDSAARGFDRPDHSVARATRREDATARVELRMDRDVVSGEDRWRTDARRFRSCTAACLSRARRSVRKLVRAGIGYSCRAAVANRAGVGAHCA